MKNGVPIGFRAQGAGDTVPYGKFDNGIMESVASGVDMTIYEEVPTNVSKNVSSNDLYKVRLLNSFFHVSKVTMELILPAFLRYRLPLNIMLLVLKCRISQRSLTHQASKPDANRPLPRLLLKKRRPVSNRRIGSCTFSYL
jgi:hypothetical protein